jgi:hypothetical protein
MPYTHQRQILLGTDYSSEPSALLFQPSPSALPVFMSGFPRTTPNWFDEALPSSDEVVAAAVAGAPGIADFAGRSPPHFSRSFDAEAFDWTFDDAHLMKNTHAMIE